MFSNSRKCFLVFKHPVNLLPNGPSSSLAHRGNFSNVLKVGTQFKIPWIIYLGASNDMMASHHIFSSYSTCTKNLEVKIPNGSLSSIAGKWSIQISISITLEFIFPVPNLFCNLLSIC